MNSVLQQQLGTLESTGTHLTLRNILHGIEKEGLRVTPEGKLSREPHPDKLGSALTNGSVTTDFSESLLELITPVFNQPESTLKYLENVHQFTYENINDELIWAGSMPCRIDNPETIPLAQFGSSNAGMMKHLYRVGLKNRYGSMMQSIAGIHYNFSFPDEFWEALKQQKHNLDSLQQFRSASYFTLIRNFRRHSWLLLYLFGASPALPASFLAGKKHTLQKLDDNTLHLPYATSLRMSDLGYSTNAQASLKICFNHLETYTKSLYDAIHTPYPAYEKMGVKVDGKYKQLASTILQIENEYYSDIRPKRVPRIDETSLQALQNGGVEYIEVRNTDINPFLPLGIDLDQALFMDVFLVSCLLMGDELLSQEECNHASENLRKVTTQGRKPGVTLSHSSGDIELKTAGELLLNDLNATATFLDTLNNTDSYSKSLFVQSAKLKDSSLTPSAKVLEALHNTRLGYSDWILEKSNEHKTHLLEKRRDTSIQKKLRDLVETSKKEQAEIEENDSLSFDEYLKVARTGQFVGDAT